MKKTMVKYNWGVNFWILWIEIWPKAEQLAIGQENWREPTVWIGYMAGKKKKDGFGCSI